MTWTINWTKAEEAHLKELWNEGVPAREMAKRLGRTQGAVYRRVVNKRKEDPIGFPSRYVAPSTPRKPKKMEKIQDKDYLKKANLVFLALLAKHHYDRPEAAEFIASLGRSIASIRGV